MRTIKAATLAILFLLIPHQEPRAESSSDAAPTGEAADRPSTTAVAENDGYVWSLAASRAAEPAPRAAGDHLQTDGYSWSARSDRGALDTVR